MSSRTAITAGAALAATIGALAGAGAAAAQQADPPPAGANDFTCKPSAAHPRPVVLVHGLSSSMGENWGYHSPRIAAAGYCVFALTYGIDPRTESWPRRVGGVVRMQRSSREFKAFVRRVRRATGARKVDLVGHSEGTVMPRYYLERRGGAKRVKRFVAITPLWRGTEVGGFAMLRDLGEPYGLSQPLVEQVAGLCGSCPQFLRGSGFLNDLNSDGEAIPGIRHTNIVTAFDLLVVPYTSGLMVDGGRNIVLQDVCPLDIQDHSTMAFDPVVTRLILNALDPRAAKPVEC